MTFDQQFSRMSDEELLKEVNLAQKSRAPLSEDGRLWRQALLVEAERRNLYHGGKSEEPLPDISAEAAARLQDNFDTEVLSQILDRRGLVYVLDMLNEYCKKQEDNASELTNAFKPWGLSPKKRWWAARAHIEHCSNFVEMIEL